MHLLIIGSSGQLAYALRQLCPDAILLDRSVMDLAYPEQCADTLNAYNPYAIINAAAYTQVDNAEKEEALAMTVNAETPKRIALFCKERNIPFVNVSSDYVFDGSGDSPWKKTDPTNPLNAYGRSKVAGEKAVAAIGGKYCIFRTSWMYGAEGKNFPNTIIRLASTHEELRVISDQFGAPTYAPHLAQAMLAALETAMRMSEFPSGIYHLCNAGVTTWYEFAGEVIQYARYHNSALMLKNIIPIPADEYPLPARRPANSRLDCSKTYAAFNVSMPDWREGVKAYIQRKYENI